MILSKLFHWIPFIIERSTTAQIVCALAVFWLGAVVVSAVRGDAHERGES